MSEVIESVAAKAQPLTAQAQHPHPLSVIEHAVRSGASPDQLERLLELQVRADNHQIDLMREKRRMEEEDRKSAALQAFRRDFAAFRGENIVVAKDKHVDRGRAGSFMQAEFHSIAQALSPALSAHGFSFRHDQKFGSMEWPTTDNPSARTGWVWVTCYLEHKDGHAEVLDLEGPAGDQSANTPVQNMQLTASYLKRQSLLAITGTATGGEDDENKMGHGRNARSSVDRTASTDRADANEVEALCDAGRNAAMAGMADLTRWWASLTPKQQKEIGSDFGSMRKAARAADEVGRK